MAFNATSFLAGVGSVVAVLSTGVAGGYFLASPSHIDPPNRLQRVAAANQDPKPAPVTTATKPDVVALAATPELQPAITPAEAKAPEPAPAAAVQEAAAAVVTENRAKPETKADIGKENVDKVRTTDARAAESKRIEIRKISGQKIAEQRRKQRELEVAAFAVRRIIHQRDGSDVDSDQTEVPVVDEAPAAKMPHFNLFGE
jgi:hypothetical protein